MLTRGRAARSRRRVRGTGAGSSQPRRPARTFRARSCALNPHSQRPLQPAPPRNTRCPAGMPTASPAARCRPAPRNGAAGGAPAALCERPTAAPHPPPPRTPSRARTSRTRAAPPHGAPCANRRARRAQRARPSAATRHAPCAGSCTTTVGAAPKTHASRSPWQSQVSPSHGSWREPTNVPVRGLSPRTTVPVNGFRRRCACGGRASPPGEGRARASARRCGR